MYCTIHYIQDMTDHCPMPINVNQCWIKFLTTLILNVRSMPINTSQCFSMRDQCRSHIDHHCEKWRSIDRHCYQFHTFDQHWLALGNDPSCSVYYTPILPTCRLELSFLNFLYDFKPEHFDWTPKCWLF